ncbi:MAG: methyltransferase [Candidatus Aenigmarchaeota archaeon]|nr:methyltransferase [Candidatus Aenigmarchaeota archaeon]
MMAQKFYYKGLVLNIPEGVYAPSEDSLLFAETLENMQLKGIKVLEIGTGSGFLAILAARKNAKVDACDINPIAVKAARKNAEANGAVFRAFVSDLFKNVKGRYEIIIFNPPYLPEDEEDEIAGRSMQYSGGRHGNKIIKKFLDGAKRHLNKDGRILIVISSLTKHVGMKKYGFETRVIGKRKMWFEELLLMELTIKRNMPI